MDIQRARVCRAKKPRSGTWSDVYMTLIADCEKCESQLTEWEVGFIDSIRYRLEKELPLSAKQTETLDKIWDRVTSRG